MRRLKPERYSKFLVQSKIELYATTVRRHLLIATTVRRHLLATTDSGAHSCRREIPEVAKICSWYCCVFKTPGYGNVFAKITNY